jgi:hypothetical protein
MSVTLYSINSKWIKDRNLGPETLKLVQRRAGNPMELIGIGNDSLSRTQMFQQLREIIDKWDCKTKWSLNSRGCPQNGRKIFANYTSDKGLITRIYKELKKLNSPRNQ